MCSISETVHEEQHNRGCCQVRNANCQVVPKFDGPEAFLSAVGKVVFPVHEDLHPPTHNEIRLSLTLLCGFNKAPLQLLRSGQ